MSTGAAFFDLDRTILAGASGPVFSEAMREGGIGGKPIPGEKLLFGLFNRLGETRPTMELARLGANLVKGRSREAVQAAAEIAADRLVELVQPFAPALFDEHRAAGRALVMATTTPYDLVLPLARRLGFDDVVATRYGEHTDGTYDGTIAGHFVWSHGKLAAVQEWADVHGIDLDESYAYSDSYYDSPLLGAVGHPYAVNPDPRLVLMAAARRWPTLNLDVPPGVAKVPVMGMELQRIAMNFTRPMFFPYAKFDIEGEDLIPTTGPVILVANHRSYFDSATVALLVARTGRTVRFLGKKEVFDTPVIGQIAAAMGGIRVDRGTGSDEPLQAAADALAAGEMVALMPQGTIPRGRAFFETTLKARWGAARLAAMSHATVIPVGLWGTEKVWPRNARLPNMLNVVDPPTVRVRVGPPVTLKYKSPNADTKRIMAAIVDLLPDEARVEREPTAEELARTLPAGYKGDPDHETKRRPGTDK